MRRTLLAVFLLSATTLFGANASVVHFILSPNRLLNEQEQADLAWRGLVIERVLTNGRYLVHLTADATVTDADPRIASLRPLTGDVKLHRSALHELASTRPYARLQILFHDDVSFDAAKSAIEAAGGTLAEPLQNQFHVPQRIPALISPSAISSLAADNSVLLVYGPRNLPIESENAVTAAISNVTPLFSGPYNLSGQGVSLSYFELAQADASHREFQGRLTAHGPFQGSANPDVEHATHVGGTMIAAGLDPSAKGMAPSATLDEYDANNDNFLDVKNQLTSRSDNNSWGYVLGWCDRGSCTGWVWSASDLYYGGYDALVTAPLDKITRDVGVLMVHSAGNDADKLGPQSAPFAHGHFDDAGKIVTGYCYSADGSGTDCPVPCKAGATFCETVRHPQITSVLPAPWMSIGLTASAKNVVAVGAVDTGKNIASFSSRGPTRDGRLKPDLVARGIGVYSSFPTNLYSSLSGTSMSSPAVTGASALLVEQWRRMFGGVNPTPAALKTLMLATAQDLGNRGPDFTYGFGLLDARAAVDTIIADGGQARRIKMDSLATAGRIEIPLTVTAAGNLRVVLGWSDPEVLVFPVDSGDPTDPLAASTLVNDLDVKVVDPNGSDVLPYVLDATNPGQPATHGVNHIDNTEEVEIVNAVPGIYKVVVTGTSVTASSPQAFVLVVTNGELGAAVVPCSNPFASNNSQGSAYGNVVSSQSLSGRTCDVTNASFFKFLVDKPGTVSVTVTATDTPVRLTLSSDATQAIVADIPAGQTQTVSTTFSGTTSTEFFAQVAATGTIGSTAKYTITPNFPSGEKARRRSVRRSH